jgi:predicted PurR-regulated permease PerM
VTTPDEGAAATSTATEPLGEVVRASRPQAPPKPTSAQVQLVAFEPRRFRKALVWVFGAWILVLIAMWAFDAVGHLLFLLLLAWLFAIAMEPPVRYLATGGMRRGLGTALVMLGILLVTLIFVAVFGQLFVTQLSALVSSIPDVVDESIRWVNTRFNLNLNPNDILRQFNISASSIASIAGELAGGVLAVVAGFLSGIFDVVTVLVFGFYLAADGPRLRRTIGSWLPPGPQSVLVTTWDITVEKTGGFVISKVLLATVSSFAHCLAFVIIGVPYWLPMGILAGVVSQFIPTIGTYIGILIPCLFALYDDPVDVIWIVAFATVYQQVENYVFMPRISRWTMNLHPAVALVSVFAGAAIFGPIGAIIGMPLAAAALSIVETYGRRYELIPQLRELESGGPAPAPGQTAS